MTHKAHHKQIAFVMKKGETYHANFARCYDSEGDNDSFIEILATQNKTTDLAEAQAGVESIRNRVDEVMLEPVDSGSFQGIIWYSVVEAAQNKDQSCS